MAWRDFLGLCLSRGPVGGALAFAIGVMWWWAVLRLLVEPGRVGPVEGAVAAGGWGLSLLPVHCVPRSKKDRRGSRGGRSRAEALGSVGVRAAGASSRPPEGVPTIGASPRGRESEGVRSPGTSSGSGASDPAKVTKACGRRRWGGGAGRS